MAELTVTSVADAIFALLGRAGFLADATDTTLAAYEDRDLALGGGAHR